MPYGTVQGSSDERRAENGFPQETETEALLGPRAVAQSSLRTRLSLDLRRDWADLVLLACYSITGILDSAAISTWGAFVSMQTGNTVYLGLGPTAGTNRWKKSGSSILAFCLGSLFFSRLHRTFTTSPRRKWIFCLSFALQTAFIFVAAAIVTWGPKSKGPDDAPWYVLVPIALVAFQSCGQAVASRALRYNALTSVVLTSIYCDLFSDAELFESIVVNVERNRRVAAPLLLFAGAVTGGWIAKSDLGASGALWTAASLKLVTTIVWMAWPVTQES